MYWNVTNVKILDHLALEVTFEDGLAGQASFPANNLSGALAPLKDPKFFEQVTVSHGALSWPGDIDIAPDAMHDDIKKKGEWVLGPARNNND